jgi:hypothetical protein
MTINDWLVRGCHPGVMMDNFGEGAEEVGHDG